jgi:predicted component of type VI protein secretion system
MLSLLAKDRTTEEGSTMSTAVILTVTSGGLGGRQFTFHDPGKRLVGRADGCDVCLPNDRAHQTISRLHCLLDIHRHHVYVLDVGSRNGTYVNGRLIGPGRWPPQDGSHEPDPAGYPLHDGDELRVGNTVFRVRIADSGTDTEFPQAHGARDYTALM